MNSELVKRLRNFPMLEGSKLCGEAADYIEALEDALETALQYVPEHARHWLRPDGRKVVEANTGGWQPIATAPKDGALFLAYMGDNNMEIARYRLESNEWWIDAYAPPHIKKNWMEAWMPLPDPPK
jgi:hypothetical protein